MSRGEPFSNLLTAAITFCFASCLSTPFDTRTIRWLRHEPPTQYTLSAGLGTKKAIGNSESSTRRVEYLISLKKPTTGNPPSASGWSTASQGYFFLADSLNTYTSPSLSLKPLPSVISIPITSKNRQSTKMQVKFRCLSALPLPHT